MTIHRAGPVYSHFSIDEHRAGPVSRLSKMTIHRAGPVYSLVQFSIGLSFMSRYVSPAQFSLKTIYSSFRYASPHLLNQLPNSF